MSRARSFTVVAAGLAVSALACYDLGGPSPTIALTSVSPRSGPIEGGTIVTITGTNFTDATRATIGGRVIGGLTVVSRTEIKGFTPTGSSTGERDVVVAVGRVLARCIGCFTYTQPPVR